MPKYWQKGKRYVCGEYEGEQIVNLLFVINAETELREHWANGSRIKLLSGDYVLMDREVDRKAGMVVYNLKRLEEPPALPL